MPRTENLLQHSLGIVNYLSRFYSKITDLMHNLRSLVKNDNKFLQNETHGKAFKCIIDMLCSDPKLLRYYRPELDLFLETDASKIAIGMALLQSESNERELLYPIVYGSTTLTDAETRYANI